MQSPNIHGLGLIKTNKIALHLASSCILCPDVQRRRRQTAICRNPTIGPFVEEEIAGATSRNIPRCPVPRGACEGQPLVCRFLIVAIK